MQTEIALTKQEQMLQDGYCFVDDILTEEFLQELRDESERLIAAHVPPPDVRYQGQHVNVTGQENDLIKRLLEWQPARAALEELGFGDFESTGGIIILTKDPGEPALYWHQDWADWENPISVTPWPQQIFVSYYLSDTSVENGCLKVIPGTITSVFRCMMNWCPLTNRARATSKRTIRSCSVTIPTRSIYACPPVPLCWRTPVFCTRRAGT